MMIHAEVLPTYRRFRTLGVQLNHKLVRTLSKEALHEGGERLGILKNGTLAFENEDQMSVLMDFCIHNVWIDGQNAVQRYREQSPPRDGSDEMVLLNAMLEGHYALIDVIRTEPGVGLTARDAMRGGTHFLADIGMSQTAKPGYVLATRLFSFEDHGFAMTGGAGLPVTKPAQAGIRRALERRFSRQTDFARLTPTEESDLVALIIRTCLAAGMGERIAYGAAAELSSHAPPEIDRCGPPGEP